MEYKTIPLADYELKAESDGWSFTAYASTFGNRDHGGDIIEKGAFGATLKDPLRDRPLLWQHDIAEPIGKELSLVQDTKGLLGKWEIIDTQRGADAYKLLKRGVVRSMSIGYMPKTFEFEDGGDTRVIKEIDLLENSVVSIPMNDQARIQSVKHLHCATCASLVATAPTPEGLTAVRTDVSFEVLLDQVKKAVQRGAQEAEALSARRAEEKRKLTEAHVDALTLLNEELKGSQARVEAILSTARASDTPKGERATGLLVELAKRRARSLGIEV